MMEKQLKRLNISKSLINSYYDYKEDKMCGVLFKAMHIDKTISMPPSKAALLGHYFEYKAVNYTSANATELMDNMKEAGLILKSGQPGAEMKRVDEQIKRCHEQLKLMDIKIVKRGEVIEYDGYKAITDIVSTYKGKACIIDLKTTGMMDNKWEDYGWDLDSLEYKHKMMIQAKLSKWIWYKLTKADIDFFFWVFSRTEKADQRFIHVDVTPETMGIFDETMKHLKTDIYGDYMEEFKPKPEYNRCRACPLYDKCEHKKQVVEPYLLMI